MGRRSLSAVASPVPSLYILMLVAELNAAEQGTGGAAGINHGPLAEPDDGGLANDHVNDDNNTTHAGVEVGSQAEPEEVRWSVANAELQGFKRVHDVVYNHWEDHFRGLFCERAFGVNGIEVQAQLLNQADDRRVDRPSIAVLASVQ
ncbi:hypothetical protein FRC09_005076 [Ceratobasidium sp. 395]|nr:hypothetical protein FRC09_005076 [Ceratobasidium sp. 395]